MNNISKEQLNDLYHTQNLSESEICNILNITLGVLRGLRKKYEISPKTAEEISAMRWKSNQNNNTWSTMPFTDQELIELYINQNLTMKEISDQFNIKIGRIRYKIESLGLVKDKQQTKEAVKSYCLKTYGATNPIASEKSKQNSIEARKNNKSKRLQNGEILRRTSIDIDQYIIDHQSGKYSNVKLAEKYNISLSTVKSYNKQLGLHKTVEQKNEEMQRTKMSDETYELLQNREALKNFIKSNKLFNGIELANRLGIGTNALYIYLQKLQLNDLLTHTTSQAEHEIKSFIESLGVITRKDRTILAPLEIDIYCQEQKIAIEFNGDYWHSDINKDKNYHYQKSLDAEKKGIRLIHIYEHEWNNPVKQSIIKSMLKIALGKANERVYARNCEIRKIDNTIAQDFNNTNHLQGHRHAQVTYGLFYNNQLVQLMSFSKTKYNKNLKNNDWEIIRGCPGSNNTVVGGVSKLFKHFIREYNPNHVFSYCDFNKFDGKGYEALGMEMIGYTGPDMKWLMKDGSIENRQPSKHKYFVENSQGKIWGSGSKKYLWTNPDYNK